MARYIAYCWASGQIEIGTSLPKGALPILKDTSKRRLTAEMRVSARHAYDGKTLLVPGVPEAPNQKVALAALCSFVDWIKACHAKRAARRAA
jgi:hypothetical protein